MNCEMSRSQFLEAYYKELSSEQSDSFTAHLTSCEECASEYQKLTSVLDLMSERATQDPGKDYWDGYFYRLQERIQKSIPKEEPVKRPVFMRRSYFYQLAAALILVGIGIIIGKLYFGQNAAPIANVTRPAPTNLPAQRAAHFLDRSQVLLLGVVNATPEDFSQQSKISRSLVHEASLLKNDLKDPKDRRLRELVSELEVILLQIANLEQQNDLSEVETVRSGVDRKGVLFKINLEQMRLSDQRLQQAEPKVRRKNVF